MENIEEGYASTMAMAMTIIGDSLMTMKKIGDTQEDKKPIILGTMLGAQAVVEMVQDMFTSKPMPKEEFMTMVAEVRKDFERFTAMKR